MLAALGEMVEIVGDGRIELILTETLGNFIECTDWCRERNSMTLLREIYQILAQLFLSQQARLTTIDLNHVVDYRPHPIPRHSSGTLIEVWSDEVGRLLKVHDKCNKSQSYFIGIACAYAFVGDLSPGYDNQDTSRAFPLVGPEQIDELDDAYEWEFVQNIYQKYVSVDIVKKRCTLLGGVCEPPHGGSHIKVKFKGGHRSWVLDPNVDPIPDAYLKELVSIVHRPLPYIKHVLLTGQFPAKVFKLKCPIE